MEEITIDFTVQFKSSNADEAIEKIISDIRAISYSATVHLIIRKPIPSVSLSD